MAKQHVVMWKLNVTQDLHSFAAASYAVVTAESSGEQEDHGIFWSMRLRVKGKERA